MLILSRKVGEQIVIDGGITILVTYIGADQVKLGIEAPPATRILRSELIDKEPTDAK